jgi:hypothetical protein
MRDPRIPDGLGPQRSRVLEVALAELDLGVHEMPLGSNRGPRVDVYLPRWAQTRPGPPWCAWFATWVLERALGKVPTGRRRGGVARLVSDAQRAGLYLPLRPGHGSICSLAPGDLFAMDHGPRSGGHVGIVLRVDAAGREISTIEGNSGHRVRLGRRRLDDPEIVGTICTVPDEPCLAFERGLVAGAPLEELSTR